MGSNRVIVIGAGIGGLVSALELAARGVDVLVLERAGAPGGKMRQVGAGENAMDAGPTVFTMRWVFEELFASVGAHLADHLDLQPVGILARHAWQAGEQLDLHADVRRSAQAIGEFAGAQAARGYVEFCARARRTYRALERPFMRASRPGPFSLATRAGLSGLPDLLRISPFVTLWQALGDHFSDPRLRQLFGRYATYCGSSPFQAPATLMLVAHVEQDGVWLVRGGMHRIAQALVRLAGARGARFRFDAPVREILTRDGRTCGVRLADGEELAADAVIFNGEPAALAGGLLGKDSGRATRAVPPPQRSLSALTWNLVAHSEGFELLRHTVFFSGDYPREFDDIVRRSRLPSEPTVYVCAQDRDETDHRNPTGPERLLLIVNAPARGDTRPFAPEEIARCESQTFRLMERCGLRLDPDPACTVRTTPHDFERLFPASGGALYGQASHGWMASFSRPGARSKLPGLYLAGGSTHPGPGVPMAALSGRQAAASALADLATARGRDIRSTPRSEPAVMPGGTSTR